MQKSAIDPELNRQLQAAEKGQPVEAVIIIRQSSATTQSQPNADALLRRIGDKYAKDQVELNYMPRLGVLAVRGPPDIIKWLIDQPEVEIASANQHSGYADPDPTVQKPAVDRPAAMPKGSSVKGKAHSGGKRER